MGCDIHWVIEKKMKGTEKWVGILYSSAPNINSVKFAESQEQNRANWYTVGRLVNRNYGLFGALAGVRESGPDAKGLPENISTLTEMEVENWGRDGHSHSWDTLDDFCGHLLMHSTDEVKARAMRKRIKNNVPISHGFLEYLNYAYSEYRVIYWFDN